jgi:hypothetical protein
MEANKMRIRAIGKTLHLFRYAGYNKENKIPMEAKIGSVGMFCLPIVLDNDSPININDGVPISLWRKLTIEEQEKLLEDLKVRQVQKKRIDFEVAIDNMKNCLGSVDVVTPELALSLWEQMGALQRALKKAGHPKPQATEKTAQKGSKGSQDTLTIPIPLDLPEKI